MSPQRKEHSSNCYYPAFLCMDIETWDPYVGYLTSLPLETATEAAILHEYIHYLQDITTVSGLTRICVVSDRLRWGATWDKRKLELPLEYRNVNRYNLAANNINLKVQIGDDKLKVAVFPDEFDLRLEYGSLKGTDNKNIKTECQLIVAFDTPTGDKFKYAVGDQAISESMAYMIESAIYPNALQDPPPFPYFVVEQIIQKKFPNLYDLELMVALCDVSLLFQFPGMVFYDLCCHFSSMAETQVITFMDIYAIAYGRDFIESRKVIDRTEALATTMKTAQEQLKKYFNMVSCWGEVNILIDIICNNALWLRQYAPYFIIDILRGGPIYKNTAFKLIISRVVGCPCLYTASGEILYYQPDVILTGSPYLPYYRRQSMLAVPEWVNYVMSQTPSSGILDVDVALLRSARTIHDILFTELAVNKRHGCIGLTCPLTDWCSNSFKRQKIDDLTKKDQNCKGTPWMHANDRQSLNQCAFGRLWAAWGLAGKKLTVRNK